MMYALFRQAFDDLLAELAQRHAGLGHLRAFFDQAEDVAVRRVGIETQQQVGRRKMEKAERVRLHELRAVDQFAQHHAGRRRLTAMMASQALAEASRWLTGQMPQMRAVIDGIS